MNKYYEALHGLVQKAMDKVAAYRPDLSSLRLRRRSRHDGCDHHHGSGADTMEWQAINNKRGGKTGVLKVVSIARSALSTSFRRFQHREACRR